MSVYKVLDKVLNTSDFTVGGGSASAIAGAMAAGLVGMVSRLSVNKDYGLSDVTYLSISDSMDTLCQELATGAEEDTKAFMAIKEAFALPKANDEDKRIRNKAINDAAFGAATVPLENARRVEMILKSSKELDGRCNPNAASDITIGAMLARVAVLGCVLNVEANLPLVKEECAKDQLQRAANDFRNRLEQK